MVLKLNFRWERDMRGMQRGLWAVVAGLALGCGAPVVEPEPTADAGTTTDAGPTDGGPTGGGTPDAGTPDTDMAVVRLQPDGTLDRTFGTEGIARVDLGTAVGSAGDGLWNMTRDAQDRLVLFGQARGGGTRVDLDRVVVRLTASGVKDVTFGKDGVHTLDIANLNDIPKSGFVQADGKIVVSGYTSQPTGYGTQSQNRIVLLRLNADGTPDTTFGAGGVVNSAPFAATTPNTGWGMAEAYAVGQTSRGYVTTGYGRLTADQKDVDLVSFRYDLTNGAFDTSWGTDGSAVLNLVGDNDRGRNLVVLPDDRVLMVGSGTPAKGNIDAMAVMLRADGTLDTDFDPNGYKLFSFDRADEGLFGVALSPAGDRIAAVGYRGGTAGGATDDDDDDAVLMVMGVGAGASAPVATAVPLSETAHDRLWAVTFDASGRIYAAGYLAEGTDNRMVVARFTSAGALDTTFGTGGKVTVNVTPGGAAEMARGIVVQTDGKLVIGGTAERP